MRRFRDVGGERINCVYEYIGCAKWEPDNGLLRLRLFLGDDWQHLISNMRTEELALTHSNQIYRSSLVISWPSKIACFLNIVLMIGFCTINCIIGGQILSAVSGGGMSIVGIIVVALVCWVVAVVGMSLFHT